MKQVAKYKIPSYLMIKGLSNADAFGRIDHALDEHLAFEYKLLFPYGHILNFIYTIRHSRFSPIQKMILLDKVNILIIERRESSLPVVAGGIRSMVNSKFEIVRLPDIRKLQKPKAKTRKDIPPSMNTRMKKILLHDIKAKIIYTPMGGQNKRY